MAQHRVANFNTKTKMLPNVEDDADNAENQARMKISNSFTDTKMIWSIGVSVTMKGPDGKHPITDYGAMSHREVLQFLGKPTVHSLINFEEIRQSRLARFKPIVTSWPEMECCVNRWTKPAEDGPEVRFHHGEIYDQRHSYSYIDRCVRELGENAQLVINLGIGSFGSNGYMETRDFASSDIIDKSVTSDKRQKILEDFGAGKFRMLFISPDVRHEVHAGVGAKFWRQVAAIVIEEFGNITESLDFKLFLKSCSIGYSAKLPMVNITTLFRVSSAEESTRQSIASKMRAMLVQQAQVHDIGFGLEVGHEGQGSMKSFLLELMEQRSIKNGYHVGC